MPEYVSRRHTETIVEYCHEFQWNEGHAGFSFTCEKDGSLIGDHPSSKENYDKCLNGTYDVKDMGIQRHERSYRHSAVIKCVNCSEHVGLQNNTNTCECGTDYNMSGQRLAPREQWGEETGEHWTECF